MHHDQIEPNTNQSTWLSMEQVAWPAMKLFHRPTGDLWKYAVDRGHGGAMTQRPLLATTTWQ